MSSVEQTLETWCHPTTIKFDNPQAEENYKKRTRRIADSIQLKRPDRVPLCLSLSNFPALHSGMTLVDIAEKPQQAHQAWLDVLDDLQPDIGAAPAPVNPVFRAIGYRVLRLPGVHLPPTSNFQYVEKEYVKAEEFYDHFLDDPTDFLLRVLLPRVSDTFEPLSRVRTFREHLLSYERIPASLGQFAQPEMLQMLQQVMEAAKAANATLQTNMGYTKRMLARGFPTLGGGFTQAPFDIIGDHIRGTTGVMLDMFRHPEKLLAAMEKLVPYMIELGLQGREKGNPSVMIPLHKHADGFISLQQFRTFYWPTLRKVMLGIIDAGLVPAPFWEGENTSRLETIRDIPRGSAIYMFQDVDLHRFKEICGDTVCFQGNVPISLLCAGTPQQVRDYVKKLIGILGKDGGLLVNSSVNVEDARYENIRAMVEAVREYGNN